MIYFIITENCNQECRHCYLEAGSGKPSISSDDFKKAIGNLPKISLHLKISGGEIFTIKNTLYGFLEHIQKVNSKREEYRQGKISLGIQTNGFWATNEERVKATLFELASFGVNEIDVASNDKFHFEKGIKKENLERLVEIAKKSNLFEKVKLRGIKYNKWVMPLGRGEKINPNPKSFDWDKEYCKHFLDNYSIVMQHEGSLYGGCCFFKIPGNLIDEPLVEIIRKLRKEERMIALNSGGIKKLARYDGWRKEDIEDAVKVYGKCCLCYGLYIRDMWKK